MVLKSWLLFTSLAMVHLVHPPICSCWLTSSLFCCSRLGSWSGPNAPPLLPTECGSGAFGPITRALPCLNPATVPDRPWSRGLEPVTSLNGPWVGILGGVAPFTDLPANRDTAGHQSLGFVSCSTDLCTNFLTMILFSFDSLERGLSLTLSTLCLQT